MSGHLGSKINQLMRAWPKGAIASQKWLSTQNISRKFANSLSKSGWINHVGHGLYCRGDDKDIVWQGVVFALQSQLDLNLHVGAKTALEEKGYGHFIPNEKNEIWLFASLKTKLPRAIKELKFKFRFVTTDLFGTKSIGYTKLNYQDFNITLSSPERAIMEALYLVPKKQSLEEAFLLMENLHTLRPQIVQTLLEECRSIKVKRLFMAMAEKLNHPWVKKIQVDKINMGSGKRSLVNGGALDKKYHISLPL